MTLHHRAAWLAVALSLGSASATVAREDVVRTSVPLPGGAAALSAALGATRPFDRAFVLLDAIRMVHENPPGESARTDDLRRRLRAHAAALASPRIRRDQAETIPLPLTPRIWSDVVFGRPLGDADVALAIADDRNAALLYTGLAALDDETLAFMAGRRDLLTALYREHAAVFAAFGRSVRISGGEIQLPGGSEARAIWDALAMTSSAEPGAFILRLLGADFGRLAFFYDTAAHLDEAPRRYALSLDRPDAERMRVATALYRVVSSSFPSWQPAQRPFTRPPLDASLLFRTLRFDEGGRLAGPAWPELWEAIFVDRPLDPKAPALPDDPVPGLASIDGTRRLDAAWLAERTLSPLYQAGRPRLDTLLFAQRVFATRSPADALDLLVALRGFQAFPAMALTLERIGAIDPALYARAARRAAVLSSIPSTAGATLALGQLQALTAILERVRRAGTLDAEATVALVTDLMAVEADTAAGYRGALARWIDATLLPALWRATGEPPESSSAELVVLTAMAGATARPAPERLVEWEGRPYRFDPATAELSRLTALREEQRGPGLDAALAFTRAAAAATGRLDSRQDIVAAATALRDAARDLPAPVITAPAAGVPAAVPREAATTAVSRAMSGDLRQARIAVEATAALAEPVLVDALVSLVYALALGAPDGPALAGGNVALRHDFGLSRPRVASWQILTAWDLPREETAGGWHVSGSLLGLDLTLARLALRRLATDAMPSMPALNANERRTFVQSVPLADVSSLSEGDVVRLVRTLEAGRARVDALLERPATLDAVVADAHLSEWRREALRWALASDRETVTRSISRLEWLWLGGDVGTIAELDAWGPSALSVSGCWCPAFPRPAAWEEFAGRPMTGQLATRLPDLALRVAEELVRLGLPAGLLPGVLAAATSDLLYEAQPAHYDDWLAVVRYIDDLPAEQFVDYVSMLTAGGPLVPVEPSRGGIR